MFLKPVKCNYILETCEHDKILIILQQVADLAQYFQQFGKLHLFEKHYTTLYLPMKFPKFLGRKNSSVLEDNFGTNAGFFSSALVGLRVVSLGILARQSLSWRGTGSCLGRDISDSEEKGLD